MLRRIIVGLLLATGCNGSLGEEEFDPELEVALPAASGVQISADADTYARSGGYTGTNYGGSSKVYVDLDDSGTVEHGYIRFSVGAFPTITRATLSLFV